MRKKKEITININVTIQQEPVPIVLKKRVEFYKAMFDIGAKSQNSIRDLE